MIVVDTKLPKLCHRKAGDVIMVQQTTNEKTPAGIYMVCRNDIGREKAPERSSAGLYNEGNPLFLVNLHTGEAAAMPHLSTRIEWLKDATVYAQEEDMKFTTLSRFQNSILTSWLWRLELIKDEDGVQRYALINRFTGTIT